MMSDADIICKGMKILSDNLGIVETERFVMFIQKESFDCTKWQEDLLENMSIEAIREKAAAFRLRNVI